jgi:hypothetical protein
LPPPNPNGFGLLTNIGILWYKKNIVIPTIIKLIFAGRKILCVRSLRLSKGDIFLLFSTTTKSTSDIVAVTEKTVTGTRLPALLVS